MVLDNRQSLDILSLFDPTYVQQVPMQSPITARGVKEALGAVQPAQGGTVADILSQRFEPTVGDSADALLATMMSGNFQTAQDRADARGNQYLKTLATLGSINKLTKTNAGGATGEIVDRLMAENPNLSFRDALYQYQTGWRQGLGLNEAGEVEGMAGYNPARRETKYAESAGTQQGKLEYAAPIATATAMGKAGGEYEGQQIKNAGNAGLNAPVIAKAQELLPQATSGGLGALGARGKQFFGISDDATKADAQLRLLSSKLTAAVPRFEGPQGVLDVQLYQQAAGDVGNSSLPSGDRMAALETIMMLNEKYGQPAPSKPQSNIKFLGFE